MSTIGSIAAALGRATLVVERHRSIGVAYPANASPEIVKMIDLLAQQPAGQPFIDLLVNLQISNVDLLNNARASGQLAQQPYLDLVNWLQIARSKLGQPVDTASPAAVAAKQMTAAQYAAASQAAQTAAASSTDPKVKQDAAELAKLAASTAAAATDDSKSIVQLLPSDPTAGTPGAAAVDPGSPAPVVPGSSASADPAPKGLSRNVKIGLGVGGGLALLGIVFALKKKKS